MPQPSSRKARQSDVNPADSGAGRIASKAKDDRPTDKDPAAVALGRKGGLKGGKARAAKLTKAQRKAIAQKAAKARWGKRER